MEPNKAQEDGEAMPHIEKAGSVPQPHVSILRMYAEKLQCAQVDAP